MARESAASLAVFPVQSMARVQAPMGLEPAEIELFQAVVNSKPAEWFGPDSVPVLVEYVRAAVMCDLLDQQVKAAIAGGETKAVREIMAIRHTESVRMLQLATKMRLTQQSRYTPDKAATAQKHATGGTRLWQRAPRGDES